MIRDLIHAARRWLLTQRIGGRIITPETRVEPAQFSEDEFPVVCRKCEYLLRGLPEQGNCPECGAPYDRGRLLVEQYVTSRRLLLGRDGKWAWRLLAAAICGACVFIAFNTVLFILFPRVLRDTSKYSIDYTLKLLKLSLWAAVLLASVIILLQGLALTLVCRRARRLARKRCIVLSAIGVPDGDAG